MNYPPLPTFNYGWDILRLIAKGTWNVSNVTYDGVALTTVATDRLGSIGKFYPFGIERPSATTNDTEKFTGYYRDAATGLDYADQRYHQPGVGRFMTADQYQASAGPSDPGSWNRYAYTRGDPVNRRDPNGTCDEGDEDENCPVSGPILGGPTCGWGCDSPGLQPCPGNQVAVVGFPCPAPKQVSCLSPTQNAVLPAGAAEWNLLNSQEQLIFQVITSDLASLGLDLPGLTLQTVAVTGQIDNFFDSQGFLNTQQYYPGQTELYLQGSTAAVNFFLSEVGDSNDFTQYASDPFHPGATNIRQNVSSNSLQISANAANGTIAIDIDPANPNQGGFIRHAGAVLKNIFTGIDTNYGPMVNQIPGVHANCP